MSKTSTITRLRRQLAQRDAQIAALHDTIASLTEQLDDLSSNLDAAYSRADHYKREAEQAHYEASSAQREKQDHEFWVADRIRDLERYERMGDDYKANRVRKQLARGW